MLSQQPKIIIIVTKSGALQARVTSVSSEPSFEVTIGGNEWMTGKGSKYFPIILKKAAELVNNLQKQLADVMLEVELRQPYTRPALQGEVMKSEKEEQPNQERRLHDRRRNDIQSNIGKRSAR